jgi:two-component system nitrogen regulation response regulator NtrX
MLQLLSRIAPACCAVLITGESGTGKELIARTIHALSRRRERPFVSINCAAIPESLIESELFGHERGAFTGAEQRRLGKFEAADGGTLFLDEIGDMSLAAQAKVLRALQQQTFERVGGNTEVRVDVRIIAATNQNLQEMMQRKLFRADLFYRLNIIPLHLQPLRERPDDIGPLSDFFLQKFCRKYERACPGFTSDARRQLLQYAWPGNIREMENLIERLVLIATESEPLQPLTAADIRPHLPQQALTPEKKDGNDLTLFASTMLHAGSFDEARRTFEREYIQFKLKEYDGNITSTARALGVGRSSLHQKIKQLYSKVYENAV